MKSVINILNSTSAITDLLADGASGVFIEREPQEAGVPYITVMSEIIDTNDTFSGENLDEWLITVICVSDWLYTNGSNVGAWDIAQEVRSAMVGATGTYNSERYQVTRMESESVFTNDSPNIHRVEVEQEYQLFSRR